MKQGIGDLFLLSSAVSLKLPASPAGFKGRWHLPGMCLILLYFCYHSSLASLDLLWSTSWLDYCKCSYFVPTAIYTVLCSQTHLHRTHVHWNSVVFYSVRSTSLNDCISSQYLRFTFKLLYQLALQYTISHCLQITASIWLSGFPSSLSVNKSRTSGPLFEPSPCL